MSGSLGGNSGNRCCAIDVVEKWEVKGTLLDKGFAAKLLLLVHVYLTAIVALVSLFTTLPQNIARAWYLNWERWVES